MKTKLFIFASLLLIVLAAFFTLSNTMFSSNRLLMENIEALAFGCPICGSSNISENGFCLDCGGNFPVCRCGPGDKITYATFKQCENKVCKNLYGLQGTLNVNYCADCN